jgi:hypothetical protein
VFDLRNKCPDIGPARPAHVSAVSVWLANWRPKPSWVILIDVWEPENVLVLRETFENHPGRFRVAGCFIERGSRRL